MAVDFRVLALEFDVFFKFWPKFSGLRLREVGFRAYPDPQTYPDDGDVVARFEALGLSRVSTGLLGGSRTLKP